MNANAGRPTTNPIPTIAEPHWCKGVYSSNNMNRTPNPIDIDPTMIIESRGINTANLNM